MRFLDAVSSYEACKRLLKLSFKEDPLDFHPDICLFLRSQPLKHFHQVHEVVLITVLRFLSVGLHHFVTLERVWLCTHHPPHCVTFARPGE